MKNNTKSIVTAAMLLAIAIVMQIIGRNIPQINQFLVGPVVNAILLLTTIYCGTKWGTITGILTPIMAYLVGQLLPSMAPFIPFIIIGNIIYVVIFGLLRKRKNGEYIGIFLGALTKYLFLFLSATKLIHWINLGIPPKVAGKLAIMMGVPQFITGIVGGAIALAIYVMLSKRRVN